MKQPTFAIIAAVDADFGIGKNGTLAWQLSADMKHFKTITTTASAGKQNVVIMGRKTWESLPVQFRPLPSRINLVLSRQSDLKLPAGVLKTESLAEGLKAITQKPLSDSIDKVFVIGGEQIFREAINDQACNKLYLTHLSKSFGCDCFFPHENISSYKQVAKSHPATENSIEYCFAEYARI